jgi:DNA-directed RNA polymerase subunit M/transcription elongation factor TFIIS
MFRGEIVEFEKIIEYVEENKYKSECPKCGNVDTLTKKEINKTVHCQRCYNHYEFKDNPFFKGYKPTTYFNI